MRVEQLNGRQKDVGKKYHIYKKILNYFLQDRFYADVEFYG